MKYTAFSAVLALAITVGASGGCSAQTDAQSSAASAAPQPQAPPATVPPPAAMQVKSVGPGEAPDEDALKTLVGSATQGAAVQLSNYPELPLSDRILQGFEAGYRALTTEDGQVINWGFKYEEANLQSVAISDGAGRLAMVAAVDDVKALLSARGTDRFSSVADYQQALKKSGTEPHVVLLARDQAALEAAYPLFRSWMDANLLGFNTSCAKHAAACALLPGIQVRTDAYISSGPDAAPVKATLPRLAAAPIPPEAFRQ